MDGILVGAMFSKKGQMTKWIKKILSKKHADETEIQVKDSRPKESWPT